MTFEKYQTEIECIKKQNNVECELYSVVANVLRDRESFNKFSIRDISKRRRTQEHKEKYFWGLCGFPDFVIIDRDFNIENNNKKSLIYGAIEIKYEKQNILDNENNLLQLKGHLLSFKNIIYTNGFVWRIISLKKDSSFFIAHIDDLIENSYLSRTKNSHFQKKLCDMLKKCKFKEDDIYKKEYILCNNNAKNNIWDKSKWKDLIDDLNKIDLQY